MKNFYVILGVPREATGDIVRTAYRSLAKQYHPDRVGPAGVSRFRDVVAAYEVLSDPERRRAHDEELGIVDTGESLAAEPVRAEVHGKAEPLVSEAVSIARAFHTSRPSVEEEFLDWTARHFTGVRLPKSGRAKHLNLEVTLSQYEAHKGGILPIRLPIFRACPSCEGTGGNWLYPCLSCHARGIIQGEKTVGIRIPGMVRDGTIWELPIAGAGVHLRVNIRVARSADW